MLTSLVRDWSTGLSKTLVSDNGTQFMSVDFKEFRGQQSIEHIRIPSYYPQSNGQAERSVDTRKGGLQNAKGEGTMEEVLKNFLSKSASCVRRGIPGRGGNGVKVENGAQSDANKEDPGGREEIE
ncbi:unnamed protein product [Hymenolepis diminuta]|uniref:Integrase catalytic domain-containing protein n=1 Tax=Hymenolepis diminuta TaxID=6216 RepID=A0A564YJ46_HYMDI|nr:unnamed protein product [Hymenolepis diminuta]